MFPISPILEILEIPFFQLPHILEILENGFSLISHILEILEIEVSIIPRALEIRAADGSRGCLVLPWIIFGTLLLEFSNFVTCPISGNNTFPRFGLILEPFGVLTPTTTRQHSPIWPDRYTIMPKDQISRLG